MSVSDPASAQAIFPAAWRRHGLWRGLGFTYIKAPESDPTGQHVPSSVVCIHGFGACKEHWRHNVKPLLDHHRVFALDLIGFGDSAKPRAQLKGEHAEVGEWSYGIDTWAEQVHDFVRDHVAAGEPVQLIGNSIGGVVALRAAALLEESGEAARQVILIDCAQRALDDKRLDDQPPLQRWARPLVKTLVRQRWFSQTLYRSLANPQVIRRVLLQAYPTGANVDDQLVDLLLHPARQPGAEEAFRGFINLFNDRMAPDLLETLHTPVAILWGAADPWEPIAIAKAWTRYPCVWSFQSIKELGHCPHDENPDLVNRLVSALLLDAGALTDRPFSPPEPGQEGSTNLSNNEGQGQI